MFSMEGGISAWEGHTAAGAPLAGMAHFDPAASLEQLVALAWGLEEGSRLFYKGVEERFTDNQTAADLFTKLVVAEVHHKQHLLDAYAAITSKDLDFDPHRQHLGDALAGKVMEGGISVETGLVWASEHTITEILDFAMALEVNAYDLYIKMGRQLKDEKAKQIFKTLADEEQLHLQRLGELLNMQT